MTDQKRRIEDQRPGQPLEWDETDYLLGSPANATHLAKSIAQASDGAQHIPAAATVLTDENWTPKEQAAFSAWAIREFPNESSQGLISLGSAFKRGQAFALAQAGVRAEPAAKVRTMPDMLTVETIQGAIAFGRMGINPPPSPDHWGNEFWQIGRQLAKLGETSAWNNVTPVDVAAQVPAAEVRAALDLVERVTGTIYADVTPGYYEATSKIFTFARSTLDARRIAQSSTADKASEVRAAEEGDAA